MQKKKDFVMSTEALNSYGFWVLTEGIDTTDFLKNPVGYFNHDCDDMPPIKWENVRVENGVLKGTSVFDEADEFAMQLWAKVQSGFINGASIGFKILEWSEDTTMLKKGQTRPTAVKVSLRECSIVNQPSNVEALAIRLYDTENILLSADKINSLPIIQNKMFEKLTTLGYRDADHVLSEVSKLKEAKTSLEAEILALKASQKTAQSVQLKALCEQKGLTQDEANQFAKLADLDFATTVEVLSNRPDYVPVYAQLAQNGGSARNPNATLLAKLASHPDYDYSDWSEKDSKFLMELEEKHPTQYQELYQKTFATK